MHLCVDTYILVLRKHYLVSGRCDSVSPNTLNFVEMELWGSSEALGAGRRSFGRTRLQLPARLWGSVPFNEPKLTAWGNRISPKKGSMHLDLAQLRLPQACRNVTTIGVLIVVAKSVNSWSATRSFIAIFVIHRLSLWRKALYSCRTTAQLSSHRYSAYHPKASRNISSGYHNP